MRALAQCGIFAAVVDAGAARLHAASGFTSAVTTGTKGVPDIIGVLRGGQALFIEVKRPAYITANFNTGKVKQFKPAGKPSAAQIEFITQAQQRGAAAGFARSVGDALAIAGIK